MRWLVILCCGLMGSFLVTASAKDLRFGSFRSTSLKTDAVALFEAKCAMCHGKDGHGTQFGKSKGAPDFNEAKWQKSVSDTKLNEAITNGRNKSMPAWKNKLSPEEINALVARVREFGKKS